MSDKEFPSCAYDVCAEFDCEETMALALIATRTKLELTRKALEIAVDALKMIGSGDIIEHSVVGHEDDNKIFIANKALEQITALEQKDK